MVGHRDLAHVLPGDHPLVDRWTAARKEELLRRIRAGEIGHVEAQRRYFLTLEEIEDWRRRANAAGRVGLKATVQGRLL